ncbi:MAG: ABC transporter ATP-binding protein [Candidatus Brocadiae bacterium]|nr:ABC transporter ATP-binding protein [Candidatus Brocadiia bacterium]
MIRIEGLEFSVGGFHLGPLHLEVAAGDYFVLLGPTGMGKTLLLESICGLLRPQQGRIIVEGEDVTALPPRDRGIGYVPQHQGLFPHLTVRRNIEFPLRVRRVEAAERRKRLEPLIELLGLGELLDRWPMSLSGGERQKVALARALASQPRVLLLDEPVSALDEPSRERLCSELRRIHEELRVTAIHVSHILEEAFSVADRAGVLHQGRLVQHGPIDELLRRPATEFVARFFRTENIIPATATPADDGSTTLAFDGHTVHVPGHYRGDVTFVVRPEAVRIHAPGSTVPNGVPAVLRRVTDRGPYRRVEFDAGRQLVAYVGRTAAESAGCVGESRVVAFPPEAIHVLPQPPDA